MICSSCGKEKPRIACGGVEEMLILALAFTALMTLSLSVYLWYHENTHMVIYSGYGMHPELSCSFPGGCIVEASGTQENKEAEDDARMLNMLAEIEGYHTVPVILAILSGSFLVSFTIARSGLARD